MRVHEDHEDGPEEGGQCPDGNHRAGISVAKAGRVHIWGLIIETLVMVKAAGLACITFTRYAEGCT